MQRNIIMDMNNVICRYCYLIDKITLLLTFERGFQCPKILSYLDS